MIRLYMRQVDFISTVATDDNDPVSDVLLSYVIVGEKGHNM